MTTDELKKHPLGMCADGSMGLVETLEMATRFPMDRRLAENMRLAGDRSHVLAREVIALRKAAQQLADDMNITAILAHALSDGLIDERVAPAFDLALQDQNAALATLRAVLGESE